MNELTIILRHLISALQEITEELEIKALIHKRLEWLEAHNVEPIQ